MQGLKNKQGLSVHLKCKHAFNTVEHQPPGNNEPLCKSQTNQSISAPPVDSIDMKSRVWKFWKEHRPWKDAGVEI